MNTYTLPGEELPQSTLQLVQIYFDTATFDEVERDKKIKMEAQLSLIGGTMGLLTGFSIISGIEIIFFLFRLMILISDQSFLDFLQSIMEWLDKLEHFITSLQAGHVAQVRIVKNVLLKLKESFKTLRSRHCTK